ncbi:MAG TPA: T9SS type A sorting domain-containing protein, partial [candidate division Zixibacteria bacterium]|nr:T9SS type A sorting domain-containing protein [candidate division Zixibacteria bacterium]
VISTGVAAPGIYDFDIVFTYQYDTIYALPAEISISRDIRLGWNLIAVPVDATPNDPYTQLSDDIVPFYNEPGHSNIYAWDPERGMWVVPSEFQRGVGYYLLAWRDHSTIDVIGTPYYDEFVMTLPYYGASAYPGWNLVGNPVNTRIDWDNIVNDPMFSGIYPTYYNGEGGSYTPGFPAGADRYIDPYEGFFVVVMPGETGVLPVRDEGIYPTFARKSDDSPSGALPDFVLRIGATVGANQDLWNYMGVRPGATDGFDAQWDGLVPPTMTTDYLSFVSSGRELSRDIRALMHDGDVKTWQIIIDDARRGDEVVISWPMDHIPDATDTSQGMNQIYAGYTFQLYDPVTGEYVDMRSTDHYSFIYDGSRTLYIYVSATVLSAEDKVPTAFALLQNTPNPFNASTEIQFALPTDGKVTLEVLDMSGRVVRTLVDGEMGAGFHRVVWDGKDKSGHEVSSGVYFYRLKTDNLTQTRKMILVK